MRFTKTVISCLFLMMLTAGATLAQEPQAQQSRISSPFRPPGTEAAYALPAKAQVTIPGVPFYVWRHGCGPTSVAMVVGYWDGQGFELIPGDASSQTDEVDQVIASGGDYNYGSDLPWPAGNEHHYENYARPVETGSQLLPDAFVTAGRTPHADDCIADFMKTSRSSAGNYYGWSWSSDIQPAFDNYAASVLPPYYQTTVTGYYMWSTLTFDVLKAEIDSGRPMVFLVDSSGDGGTDHFVTVVGYDDSNPALPQYLFHDTWDRSIHSAGFQPMLSGRPWGVWGGWAFNITGSLPHITGNLRLEVNGPLELTVVGALPGAAYQWEKGTSEDSMTTLVGETSGTYAVDAATTGDAGWYRCLVTDGGKAGVYTPAVHVEVFEHVPAASIAALAAAALGVLAIGARRVRR